MLLTDRPSIDVETLRSRLYGDVYGPDDAGWDEARRAWNLAVDQRPAAVALPLTDADVVEVVDFARAEGLRVAPQGTGHGASPIASLDRTILLSPRRMRAVRVDPATPPPPRRAGAPRAGGARSGSTRPPAAPACARAPSGPTSAAPRAPTVSRRWPAPRPTSASSATRSAAASPGSRASTGSRATACSRSGSSPPTA